MTGAVYFPGVYVSTARAAGLQFPFGPPRVFTGLWPDEATAAAAEDGLIQTVPWTDEPGPDFQRRLAAAKAWVAGLIERGDLETVKHPAPPQPERETTRSILADLKDYPKSPVRATPSGPIVPPELTDPGAVLYLAAELERDWTEVQAGLAGAEARGRDMLEAALGETGLAESPGPAAAVPGPTRFTPSEGLAVLWLAAWRRLWDEAGDWRAPFVTDVPGLADLLASRVIEVLFTSPFEVVMPPGLGPRPKRWFTVDIPDLSGLDQAGLSRFLTDTTAPRATLAQGLEELMARAAA
ncbi:MAG: hypothetical protein KKC37_05285, partial [Proteobacteria bacterium]|nr:hypothetical protein [Pseudomonadota bacterium]